MTETTNVTLPEGMTPEMIAAAVKFLEDKKAAEKAARDAAAKRKAEHFDDALPSIAPALEAIILTHDQETWFKRDPKTKQKTSDVSGIGFHATGVTTVAFPDGVQREVRVNVWVKANPKNGVPPEAVDNADENDS